MGLGLFDTPLYLNPKCLVFSAFIIFVWFMPHPVSTTHQIVVGFILATFAYTALAWYDVLYDCNDRFGPTFIGWISKPFKPKEYQQKFEELPIKYKKLVRTVDIIVLVILTGLLAYPFFVKSK